MKEKKLDYGQVQLPMNVSDEHIEDFADAMLTIANNRYERNYLQTDSGSISSAVIDLMKTMKNIIKARQTEFAGLSGISFDSHPELDSAARRLARANAAASASSPSI